MSLAVVPRSVLNSIRKLMFNFLWRRNNDSTPLHLCKWEQLSLPNKFGGWGFRNIYEFSKAMAVHMLWRVLKCGGI
jgi:hypothetical protein